MRRCTNLIISVLFVLVVILGTMGCSSKQPGTLPIVTAEDAVYNEQLYRLKEPFTKVW